MKATAAVLSGKNQVYIKEVDLPAIRGGDHKRVPDDVSKEHPVITGHE